METTDILVVGAGLAGLHVAYRLEQAGASSLLLEARDRPGGRIENAVAPTGAPSAFDLGPSWFWPHQRRIHALLRDLEIPWFDQHTRGAAVFEQSVNESPLRSEGAGAARSHRISGGTGALINGLARQLRLNQIRTGHRLEVAQHDGESWVATVAASEKKQQVRAEHLVLALPPRQLVRVVEQSALPAGMLEDLRRQQTWMSGQAKFLAVYPQPFWRTEGLAGEAFSRAGPLVEIHDASSEDAQQAALFGFLGLPAQLRAKAGADPLIEACIAQLKRLFGPQAGAPAWTAYRDWATEPFTATAADLAEAPAHAAFPGSRYAQALTEQKLWLAGSEFASREPGYLEGALEASGAVVDALLSQR